MRLPSLLLLCALLSITSLAGPREITRTQTSPPQNRGQQSPDQAGTIRISTNLVQVPVSVTNAVGHPVKDLQLADFSLEENGTPVTIAHLGEPGETRLEMVLVFDNTGSVYARFDFEQQAATSFLRTIFRPGDTVSILAIASKPHVLLGRTAVLAVALEGLGQLRAAEVATAFYDSIIAAAQMLQGPADPDSRRVQIVLSDGEDNFSKASLPDAIRETQQADCIFYSVNPGAASIRLNKVSLRGQQGMEALAAQTGGAAFLAEKTQDLTGIYGRIAAELQAQYLISYYSPEIKADNSFRTIAVRVPEHPELRIRARQGYYPAKGPPR
jgi:Ca-activated chloride channel homolog